MVNFYKVVFISNKKLLVLFPVTPVLNIISYSLILKFSLPLSESPHLDSELH